MKELHNKIESAANLNANHHTLTKSKGSFGNAA